MRGAVQTLLPLEEAHVELSRKPQNLWAQDTRVGCVENTGARNDTYQVDDQKTKQERTEKSILSPREEKVSKHLS